MKSFINLIAISVILTGVAACTTSDKQAEPQNTKVPVALPIQDLKQSETIVVNKPIIPTPSPSGRSVVKVDENNQIFVKDQIVDLNELPVEIDSSKVMLAVDENVPHRIVVSIMNKLRESGVEDIIVAVTPN
ncbi:ExbD/TolR family protein [Pontiella agarivorans]|uniref:Biopolymer transporter ExbD n=1 Tax=Pontiella agarivorans TaxID=3038953 RepID=A0ABU5N160_9BACT|nr:biopolymer transporter ExbD [Pontiella agarivorans]MDZ8120139.1 hypothetical protein [Pontiella agarivorans]